MTINTTSRKAGPFNGTGLQKDFPFSFKVFQGTDLRVVLTSAAGVETDQVISEQYTVALSVDQDSGPGGTVTMLTAPPAGSKLTIVSVVPNTQGQSIPNNSGFYPKIIENALDKLTIGLQQLGEQVSRTLRFAVSDSNSGTLPTAVQRADKLLGFDSNGDLVAVAPVAQSAAALAVSLLTSAGASMVGFIAVGTGAILRTAQAKLRERVTGQDYGCAADGVTDDSVSMQKAIDANKGGTIIFRGGPHLAAGLLLSGSSYNNTTIIFETPLLLKARATSGTSNFGGSWVGLIIKDCDGVTLVFKGDGQRTAQPVEEHCHLVGFAGVTNIKVPLFLAREMRGDGLYIGQSDWLANSANTSGVTIGLFEAVNSADDGRNGLSLISGDNINIETFRSLKVGAVIGAARMPGGLDIEPDHVYQSCKNIVIGTVNVTTAGTSGLAIAGMAGADVTRMVSIGPAVVINTCVPDQNDGLGNLTATINHTLVVNNAADVRLPNYQGRFINAYGDAVIITNSSGIDVRGAVRHVREGARIGDDAGDAAGTGVASSNIDLQVFDCCRYGLRTGKLTDCKIKGQVYAPTTGYFSGSLFAVYARDYAQINVEYSVSVTHSANWNRSYRNDGGAPATFTNVSIRDCDLSGASWGDIVFRVGDVAVPRFNVRGVTDYASIPTGGASLWVAGQYVKNSAPAVGQPKGWYFVGGAWTSEGNL